MSKTGKWRDLKLPMTPAVVTSLPFSALVSALLIPRAGWRVMFAIGGVGALIAWVPA
jgi:putative MFS transporter